MGRHKKSKMKYHHNKYLTIYQNYFHELNDQEATDKLVFAL